MNLAREKKNMKRKTRNFTQNDGNCAKRRKTKLIDIIDEDKIFINNIMNENKKKSNIEDELIPVLKTAVNRKYPFADETILLHHITKTYEFMRIICDRIINKIRLNPNSDAVIRAICRKSCRIKTHKLPEKSFVKKENTATPFHSNLIKNRECRIVNAEMLFTIMNNCFIPHDVFFKDFPELINFNSFKDFVSNCNFCNDVYICLYHADYIHVCRNDFCDQRIKTTDSIKCKISLVSNQLIIHTLCPWENDRADCAYQSKKVNVRLIGLKNMFTNPSFRSNGVNLNVNVKWITDHLKIIINPTIIYKQMKYFIMRQYDMFKKMMDEKIMLCENITDDFVKPQQKKRSARGRKSRGKKRKKIPTRRKPQRRKRRRVVGGRLNKQSSIKIRKSKSTSDKNFMRRKKIFLEFLNDTEEIRSLKILSYTHVLKVKEIIEKNDTWTRQLRSINYNNNPQDEFQQVHHHHQQYISKPLSLNSFYVDPLPTLWLIPYQKFTTRIDKPILLYMRQFLLNQRVQNVIKQDLGNELSLRCDSHKWVEESSEDFIKSLPSIISFIRRLLPGLFRIIMFFNDVKKKFNKKYSKMKSTLKAHHRKKYMPSQESVEEFTKFNFSEYFYDFTVSDEFILEIAEYLYWCKITCENHEIVKRYGFGDMTEEIVYIGGIYLRKYGLKFKNRITIIPKHPLLEKRWFLVPQNKLARVLAKRSDASKGVEMVSNILTSKCNINGASEVSFLNWKMKHGQLKNYI